ncbi:MAG: maleylpyruvate isomerase N-terminal domain-containing protein, partial [Propionibacterium sp.]|nr:maleylpyruvate isomerase N-terminal domain-containing protein [Propionibacterium sp.]
MDSRIAQFLGHADTFTQRTTSLSAAQWACPSACEGWTAQDVLDHVIDTQREVFARHGMDLGARPSGAPAEAWNAHAAAARSAAADEKTLLARFD